MGSQSVELFATGCGAGFEERSSHSWRKMSLAIAAKHAFHGASVHQLEGAVAGEGSFL